MTKGFWILLISVFSLSTVARARDQELLNQSLRHAATEGTPAKIDELVKEGADLNGQASHGETALEYAIRFGQFGTALKLIRLGADPNRADNMGVSPLVRA